jgi:hypothetical protein
MIDAVVINQGRRPLKRQLERKSHADSSLARRNSDSTHHFDSAVALNLKLHPPRCGKGMRKSIRHYASWDGRMMPFVFAWHRSNI